MHKITGGIEGKGPYWPEVYIISIIKSVILLSGYLINFVASKWYSKALVSLCLVLFLTSVGIIIAGAIGADRISDNHDFPPNNTDEDIVIFAIWGASLGVIISIKRFFK